MGTGSYCCSLSLLYGWLANWVRALLFSTIYVKSMGVLGASNANLAPIPVPKNHPSHLVLLPQRAPPCWPVSGASLHTLLLGCCQFCACWCCREPSWSGWVPGCCSLMCAARQSWSAAGLFYPVGPDHVWVWCRPAFVSCLMRPAVGCLPWWLVLAVAGPRVRVTWC